MSDEQTNKQYAFDRKNPITSYGILLFYVDDNDQLVYLLSQRRDTIEYAEFLRGRYTRHNLDTYFSRMTPDERTRLEKYTFDELWDDLWINHDNRFYRDMQPKAKSKFEQNHDLLQEMLENTTTTVLEPRWGFPKGKRNIQESELECSFREFQEETRMSIDYLNLLNLPPCTEVFKGSNGKMYSTIYYVAQVDHEIPIRKMVTNGLRTETISEEISNLRWCTISEALKLLPAWRKRLLIEADEKIREYLDELNQ